MSTWPPTNPVGFMPKPSRFERDVAKFQRRQAKAKKQRQDEAAERARWQAVRLRVYTRDKGVSRLSGLPLELHSDNPFKVADIHHIVFRSAGGTDDESNLMTVSRQEHEFVQGRNAKFVIHVAGDANKTLYFQKVNRETGQVVQEWESACPQ